MGQVTFKYDINEEESEIKMAINSRDYFCALWDIYQELRLVLRKKKEYENTVEFANVINDLIPYEKMNEIE